MRELAALLDERNLDALQRFADLMSQVDDASLRAPLESAGRHIEGLDFDTAGQAITALIAQFDLATGADARALDGEQ